jgi:hypothetical protein
MESKNYIHPINHKVNLHAPSGDWGRNNFLKALSEEKLFNLTKHSLKR